MNSLEFIDKQILFVKQNIQYHKDLLNTVEDDESIEIINSTIRLLEPDLQILYQIKSELKAWYICKKHSHINNYDSNNKRFDITVWLNTENCDFKSCASFEECLTVKKALEVKENVD